MFLGKGVLKICSKFTRERPCQSVISIKLPSNFIEIALRYGCSAENLLHIFRTPFPRNTSGWLLLETWRRSLNLYSQVYVQIQKKAKKTITQSLQYFNHSIVLWRHKNECHKFRIDTDKHRKTVRNCSKKQIQNFSLISNGRF